MHPCEIHALFTPELSRLQAFQAQGVTLKYSWRSWSGVRSLDGVVVFAIAESEVEADDRGCRCLLWSREAAARFGREASEERLAHCRLATMHGSAEGVLVRSDARVASTDSFELRVEHLPGQYWAWWGCAAQAWRQRGSAPRTRFASRAAA